MTPRALSRIFVLLLACGVPAAVAHGVSGSDASFVAQSSGAQIAPFIYLGAKPMVTGYDHLLFSFGVLLLLHLFKREEAR